MGRHRVEIKKIENKAIRQVTFAKRRNGLLKKAYEISALCDIEVALLAFSPSGKPTIFGGKKRFDQILAHYINLPQHQEGGLEDLESLQRLIDGMRRERNMYNHRKIGGEMYVDAQLEEIHRDMNAVGNQFDEIVTQLKYYEDIPSYIRTVSEIEAYEEFLRQTMNQILMQKQALEGNHRAPQLGQNYLTAPLLEKLDVGVPSSTNILSTRGGQISQAPDGGLIINGGGPANYTSRARAVSSNAATAMGSNSIYNNNTNSINSNSSVLQTSMMNFVDSNGTFPTSSRNQQGQYLNNKNNTNNSLGGSRAPSNDQGNEVRNYYFELARRLGLALPGFMTNNIIGNGNPAIGAQQINPPPGSGGPGGGAGPSGQASFQATRDPRG